jgi:hypothetical protein
MSISGLSSLLGNSGSNSSLSSLLTALSGSGSGSSSGSDDLSSLLTALSGSNSDDGNSLLSQLINPALNTGSVALNDFNAGVQQALNATG